MIHANGFGLNLSLEKAKTQVFNNDELAKVDSLFSVEGEIKENVTEFVYLGQVITSNDSKCFTEHRIARANAKFNELRDALCDFNQGGIRMDIVDRHAVFRS